MNLEQLNSPQFEAVQHIDGPILVLAGAGTGKTRVLTSRIANIIVSGKAFPGQILAVTFTNKASKEMQARVSAMTHADGIWLGTFHSIAAKILRRHAELLGLTGNYNIIDTDDQIRLAKNIIMSLGFDEKNYQAKVVISVIQRWKDLGIEASKITKSDLTSPLHEVAAKVYQEYQQKLIALGAVDFGDLLLYNIKLFTQHPEVLAEYHRRFRYILVDEYQDTNIAQYMWLRMLAQANKNICCVGDEDQSIYGWRGAEIGNILRFEQDFPGAKVVRLEQNYRSSHHILRAASSVIANNTMRIGKNLWTEHTEGEKVRLVALSDDRSEARYIASEIMMLKNKGLRMDNAAILLRAGFQTRAFEECFMNHAIAYKVIGGLKFYERMEVRDVVAYIRVAINHDDDLALERIINKPKRAIGEAALNTIREHANRHNISLFKALENMLLANEFKPKPRASISYLVNSFKKWHQLFAIAPHFDVVEIILNDSGYVLMWKQDKNLESEGRLENIKELHSAIGEFNNITEFLEHVSLISDNDSGDSSNNINIMTLHAAKGLEFDTVFLPGWEEGIFPHQKVLDENNPAALEEERRLAYVGITRARRRLYITFALHRRVYNQFQSNMPSRFIQELPEENLDQIVTTGRQYS